MGPGTDGIPPEKSLSVVIPAFNEERRIGKTLERVVAYLSGRGAVFEVIVVDDGSADATGGVVRGAAARDARVRLVTLEANRGKGAAVRRGVMEATGEWVLFSDADLSTPIEEVERLAERLRSGVDVAIGSRSLRGARVEVRQPWYREAMGKTFNRIVRLLAIRGFVDTQCGFKCFTREAARSIFERARIDRFAFDVEALILARRLGLRVVEVPIRWVNEPNSRVAIVRDSARMLVDIGRIRWNALAGLYGPARRGRRRSDRLAPREPTRP